jgi:ATP-dependent DNA helicase RecQ
VKRYSASYSKTNSNFVAQNLPHLQTNDTCKPLFAVLKNIFQRGNPTRPTSLLLDSLGLDWAAVESQSPLALISSEKPNWKRLIKGDEKNQYFPARDYLNEIWAEYLPEWKFCLSMILPEAPFKDMVGRETNFSKKIADFFLPAASLVIEVDGGQHKKNRTQKEDDERDAFLDGYGIKTFRISTSDISSRADGLVKHFEDLAKFLSFKLESSVRVHDKFPDLILLNDYKDAYDGKVESSSGIQDLNASIRLQLVLIDLLEAGVFPLNETVNIALHAPDNSSFEDAAWHDLKKWFSVIQQLQKDNSELPQLCFTRVDSFTKLKDMKADWRIDLRMNLRYDDGYLDYQDIIFIRTDYLDYFKDYQAIDGVNMKYVGVRRHEYSKVAACAPFRYKVKLSNNQSSPDEISLKYIAQNVFMPDADEFSFNLGQLPIIENVLRREHTVGLLPTGAGKSLCYQLTALLHPGPILIVCPIKSLMFDQKAEMEMVQLTKSEHITSSEDAASQSRKLEDFSSGKIQFLYVTPERFQKEDFRMRVTALNNRTEISMVVIDEVHCLSEWGHDFRTAYLTLSKTVRRCCGDRFMFLALTATASLNVLKDIQMEINVGNINVRTLTNYSRPELSFQIVPDRGRKWDVLLDIIKKEQDKPKPNGLKRCGLIFTNTVNGDVGCYSLAMRLSNELGCEVRYFCGSQPKNSVFTNDEFDKYKCETQALFKEDKIDLLVVTKAFGMGVNKSNIFYTIHYGIPSTMESLYQEGGRAARDKKLFKNNRATCYVIFGRSQNDEVVNEIFSTESCFSRTQELAGVVGGDLSTNFFLYHKSVSDVGDETDLILSVLGALPQEGEDNLLIRASSFNIDKSKLEGVVYRLSLLGVIDDWVVEDYFRGILRLDVKPFNVSTILRASKELVARYGLNDSDYEWTDQSGHCSKRSVISSLLEWIYKHFTYSRRKSLSNIYENCLNVVEGKWDDTLFKERLEGYFRFSEDTHKLQHISEAPEDLVVWTEVMRFDSGLLSDDFYFSLQSSLSRFLESFEANPGLDFISGVIALILDEFDSHDGRNRMRSSFIMLKNYDLDERNKLFRSLLNWAKLLDQEKKDLLAMELIEGLDCSVDLILQVSDILGYDKAPLYYAEHAKQRIQKINKRIYGELEKI